MHEYAIPLLGSFYSIDLFNVYYCVSNIRIPTKKFEVKRNVKRIA